MEGSPLLLYLPGIDGTGLGLIRHHQRLGKIFDVWCLHIPPMDRTPFEGLVSFVERTVNAQISYSPNIPIYLVGDSLGACLALCIAARNPGADVILVLANPATAFHKSMLQPLFSCLELIPEEHHIKFPFYNSSLAEGWLPRQIIGVLPDNINATFFYISFLADVLPRESLLWRLKMLRSASSYTSSRLHSVKVQTLILVSGKDQLLSSHEETEKLCNLLPNSRIRHFKDSGHNIFLESGVDLVTVIKGSGFYRRSRQMDYVSDYLSPTPPEFQKVVEEYRWVDVTNPVMLSTLNDGRIVRGLSGVPSDGPAILVGYHMLMGWELGPLVLTFLTERGILLRGIAHPLMFDRSMEFMMPNSSSFDSMRIMGAVPVSAVNFYKLLSRKSFVLLYPGGAREALHRKGEEYKLFWPEQSEFIRMAAKFGATIIPFGVVGEDDICQLLLDYDDLVKIPFYSDLLERINRETVRLRTDSPGEIGKQHLHLPGMLPKIPGRFYFLFGRPIETRGRKDELRDKVMAHELYLHVKSEVESCIAYLRDKREKDPYRHLFPRLLFQATHGFQSMVPTFDLEPMWKVTPVKKANEAIASIRGWGKGR